MKKITFILFAISIVLMSFQDSFSGRLKVRFLKIFPKYITWPSQSIGEEFDIVVLSDSDTLYNELRLEMLNRLVDEKPVKVHLYDDIDQIDNCEMLFISSEIRYDIDKIKNKFPKNVLLITDHYSKGIKESMIDFQKDGKPLKFALNKLMIEKSGLTCDDNLEKVALKVIK